MSEALKDITLAQILIRAQSRAEKGQYGKCPRILFHQCGYGDAGNSWLEMKFKRGGRIWLSYSPWSMALPHVHDASGYIPREILAHASEVRSGENPAAQWNAMVKFAPRSPAQLIGALVELWQPWVLKDLDLLKEAAT